MALPQSILSANTKAGDKISVTLSDLIELTRGLSATTADKINSIQKITGSLRMLALNAMIESARAGAQGRGFSVVATEVREIAGSVGVIAEQLQKELATQIHDLSECTKSMANAALGSRMVDLALNAIEIIDRNLYERTCDVRWWATDSAVVDCVAEKTPESVAYASKRLGVILNAYTVYLDLWLCDLTGKVIANGRPGHYNVEGLDVSREPWFIQASRLPSGDEYAVADISECRGAERRGSRNLCRVGQSGRRKPRRASGCSRHSFRLGAAGPDHRPRRAHRARRARPHRRSAGGCQ